MKLLRDVVKSRGSGYEGIAMLDNSYGRCHECGWHYSRRSHDAGMIMHHYTCSLYNPNGINE